MAQTGKDANSSTPMRTVPAARIEFLPEDRRWITDRIEEILESGQLTLGKYGAAFEEKFAELCGVKHAVAVNSGTAALWSPPTRSSPPLRPWCTRARVRF